jgi:hypothetical protein
LFRGAGRRKQNKRQSTERSCFLLSLQTCPPPCGRTHQVT